MPRQGIASVAPGDLGGPSGTLIQLRTGGPAALETGGSTVARIVDEAIRAVVIERAKLGEYESQFLGRSRNRRSNRPPFEMRRSANRPDRQEMARRVRANQRERRE